MQQQLPTQTMVATQQHSKNTVKQLQTKNKITTNKKNNTNFFSFIDLLNKR